MQIRLYNKKKWVTICLLAGLVFGFRGCFHRHLGADTREEVHRLLKFYNELSSHQQEDLWAALKPLSQAEQDKLQHLVAGLSPQELNAVKELGDMLGQLPEDGNATNLFQILFTVLLEKKYSVGQLKDIINELQGGGDSPELKGFMKAIFSVYHSQNLPSPNHTDKMLEDTNSVSRRSQTAQSFSSASSTEQLPKDIPSSKPDRSLSSRPKKPGVIKEWTNKFTALELSDPLKKSLERILEPHDDKKQQNLLSLLDHADEKHQKAFLETLGNLETAKKETIIALLLKHNNKKAQEKIKKLIQSPSVINAWLVLRLFDAKYIILFWSFHQKLQAKLK